MTYRTNDIPGVGKYKCKKCGNIISLEYYEKLPKCPVCKHNEYSKLK